jgi:hypothetical protein
MPGLETVAAIASIVTAGAGTVAMGFLIWYTIETHKLRVAAETQNRIGLDLSRTRQSRDL